MDLQRALSEGSSRSVLRKRVREEEEVGVVYELVRITPDLAKAWLRAAKEWEQTHHEKINRRLKIDAISRYAREMRAGDWRQNGETIKFDEDDVLCDGQHRLYAIIKFGKPIFMTVARNVPRAAMPTLDTGIIRTAGDTLTMDGHSDGNEEASALQAYHNIVIAKSTSGKNKQTPQEIVQLRELHPTIGDSVVFYKGLKNRTAGIFPAAVARALHHRFRELAGVEEACNFMVAVLTGAGVVEGSWEERVRTKLLKSITSTGVANRLTALEKRELVIKVWNYKREGRPVTKINRPKTGKGTTRIQPV